ncbi:MAG: hypothetical protein D3923_01030 [Candidatus Electrothrix sp. AR3]|nr:hypothetical protein [Candidatus Electrothrix sp. AR3]
MKFINMTAFIVISLLYFSVMFATSSFAREIYRCESGDVVKIGSGWFHETPHNNKRLYTSRWVSLKCDTPMDGYEGEITFRISSNKYDSDGKLVQLLVALKEQRKIAYDVSSISSSGVDDSPYRNNRILYTLTILESI